MRPTEPSPHELGTPLQQHSSKAAKGSSIHTLFCMAKPFMEEVPYGVDIGEDFWGLAGISVTRKRASLMLIQLNHPLELLPANP